MTTTEVANKVVSLLREGKFEEAQVTFYADKIVSNEPEGQFFKSVTSKQEVIEGGRAFRNTIASIHSLTISEPIVSGPAFAITFALDADFKENGRVLFEEICAFKVQDGKIVSCNYTY